MIPRYNLRSLHSEPLLALPLRPLKKSRAGRAERVGPWRDQAPFRFLELPYDMRFQVYRLCLISASQLFIGLNVRGKRTPSCHLRSELRRTCKSTYRECIPIASSENGFIVAANTSAEIQMQLQDIGSFASSFITDLTVILDSDSLALVVDLNIGNGHSFSLWEQLSQNCTRLASLILDCKSVTRTAVWALANVL